MAKKTTTYIVHLLDQSSDILGEKSPGGWVSGDGPFGFNWIMMGFNGGSTMFMMKLYELLV
jgi:hypothetical protein